MPILCNEWMRNHRSGGAASRVILTALVFGSIFLGWQGALAGLPTWSKEKEAPLVISEDFFIGGPEEKGDVVGRVAACAVDSKGCVYFLDTGFDVVKKYTPDGEYIQDIGRTGEGPGEYNMPTCIAIGPDDLVYVGGFSTRIAVLDSEGTPVRTLVVDCGGSPVRSLAVSPSNELYMCFLSLMDQKMIHQYDAVTGEEIASFGESYAKGGDVDTRAERLFAGGHLRIGNDGFVYYAQYAPQAVVVYNRDGVEVQRFDARGAEFTGPSDPQIEGDKITFSLVPMTSSLVLLSDGGFIVSTSELRREEDGVRPVLYDVYDRNGVRMFTVKREDGSRLLGAAPDGLVYAYVESDPPAIKKMQLTLGDLGRPR